MLPACNFCRLTRVDLQIARSPANPSFSSSSSSFSSSSIAMHLLLLPFRPPFLLRSGRVTDRRARDGGDCKVFPGPQGGQMCKRLILSDFPLHMPASFGAWAYVVFLGGGPLPCIKNEMSTLLVPKKKKKKKTLMLVAEKIGMEYVCHIIS
jgi:hypothetical protein